MAYRTADHERWNDLDFVIGIEILLSGNHPVEDVCDEMCGVYPKTFKFVGWHPFCRCIAVPKLADEDEFIKRQQALIDGEDVPQGGYSGEVTEMPQCFNDWVQENAERIENAKSEPYFIRDNRAAVEKALGGSTTATATTSATATAVSSQESAKRVDPEFVEERRKQYNNYDRKWHKLYFDEDSGGYNVAHELHQFSKSKPKDVPKSGGEAEKWLGIQLAKQGKAIEFLPESGVNGKSGDMHFDGKVWDCKYVPLANEATIRTYFKDARKADCVIFVFEEVNRYNDIMNAINREIGNYKSQGKSIDELPDVYIFDLNGNLRLIKKIKGD